MLDKLEKAITWYMELKPASATKYTVINIIVLGLWLVGMLPLVGIPLIVLILWQKSQHEGYVETREHIIIDAVEPCSDYEEKRSK